MRWVVLATAILVIVFLTATFAQEGVAETSSWYDPVISIDSPSLYPQEIYQETSIPIEISVNPRYSNRKFVDIYYRLDSGSNITLNITTYETSSGIFGKGTLDNLTDGYHVVEAYSTDTKGNTISSSTTFLVESKSPATTSTPEPTSTPYSEPQLTEQEAIIGLAITVAVVFVGLGLLFYLIKRK
jgi:hypothetical protein